MEVQARKVAACRVGIGFGSLEAVKTHWIPAWGLVMTIAIWTGGAPAAEPLGRGDFVLHPGFELSLFAREPDVVDPVALTFDERGRVFVVEMRDYPLGVGPAGQPGGTVRLLEDLDGDGRADRSVVFAGGLSYPTSIAPWNGGVVVTAPPEIVFLRDTDGDGHADVREVLYRGFHLGVTDSNVNGLRWGLDNRLHGANGGNDGLIVSTRRPGPAISIRGVDFSFVPGPGDFAPTYHTSGGFGLVFDDWGRSFGTYNINHVQQRIVPVRYLQRFPGLGPVETTVSISDHEEMSRIHPISEPETRPNHPEQSGRFSAAGGVGYVGGAGWPGDVGGSVFVCDVVGNLVHRDVLREDGPVFRATRSSVEQTNEFFAARDRALRPVGLELGPDGALYLIDMQRDVIEHPDYIPKKMLAGLDMRAGADRGRIYRLRPKGVPSGRRSLPATWSARDLVRALADDNAWWRGTAQRLLVERGDRSVVAELRVLATNGPARGRLHALWTMHGLGALDESLTRMALGDPHPGVRENALLLAESFVEKSAPMRAAVVARADDDSVRVRFQAALSLGEVDEPAAAEALGRIFERDAAHRWTRLAVLSSLRRGEGDWLIHWMKEPGDRSAGNAETEALRTEVVRELAELCGARAAGSNRLGAVLGALAPPGRTAPPESIQRAVLDGLASGVKRASVRVGADLTMSNALGRFFAEGRPSVVAAAWKLSRMLGLAEGAAQRSVLERSKRSAADLSLPVAERVDHVGLLALGSYAAVSEVLLARLAGSEPAQIQAAAVAALRGYTEPALAVELVGRWRSLAPAVRGPVLGLLLQRVAFHATLIKAIESGRLTLGELNLDLEQRRRLLRRSSPEVMARAAQLLGDEEYSNRRGVVGEWLAKLPRTGNASAGRPIFERLCAQCHPLGGGAGGTAASLPGPDLAAVAHRSVEDLVSNILDPNMAINPGYLTYLAETRDGELHSGVLASESPEAVVLLQAGGQRVVLPRRELQNLQATGLSLMPEGLEAGLTPAELRDLVAWLQVRR